MKVRGKAIRGPVGLCADRAEASGGMVPITLITGFLGAGKTTLLRHVLQESHGLRLAVLVNDFGTLNIDAELLGQDSTDVVALQNGCICCSLSQGLLGAVSAVLRRADPPDRILIEASGVSDPAEIAEALADPELSQIAPLDGIVTVADAAMLPTLTEDVAQMAARQIAQASLVVLNKTDLATNLRSARVIVTDVAPCRAVIEAQHAAVPLARLIGLGVPETRRTGPVDHVFESVTVEITTPIKVRKLHAVLAGLPPGCLRVKGDVFLAEKSEFCCHLQYASGQAAIEVGAPWDNAAPRSRLVFIATRAVLDATALSDALRV